MDKKFIFLLILGLVVISFSYTAYSACFGFMHEGNCYKTGNELRINNTYYYVDADGVLQNQKQDGESCQNTFECLNNLCSNGKCVDLYKEVAGRREVIERVSEAEVNPDINVTPGVNLNLATTKDNYWKNDPVELTDPLKEQGFFEKLLSKLSGKSIGFVVEKPKIGSKSNLEKFTFNKKNEKIFITKKENGFLSRLFTRAGLKDVYVKKKKEERVTFSINSEKIKIGKVEDYELIHIDGFEYSASRPGEPEVPTKSIKVKLPKKSKVLGIGLISGNYVEIDMVRLAPKREPIQWRKGFEYLPELEENMTVYSADYFFPGEVISYSVGQDKDDEYVYIRIRPIQYVPSENRTIIITDAEIAVQYEEQENFKITGKAISSFEENAGVENIIIFSPGFEESATLLKEFHNNEGLGSEIISVNTISQENIEAEASPYTLCTTNPNNCSVYGKDLILNGYDYSLARKIISFLRNNSYSNLKYVALIGESKQVPPSDYIRVSGHPSTDFWYSSPDYDLTPEYFIGRLPAQTPEEAVFLVNKTINWKDNIGNWYNNVAVTGANAFHNVIYIGEFITDGVIDMGYFDGFNISKKFESEGTFTRSEIEPIFTNGNYGLLYHIGHGGGDSLEAGSYIKADEVENYSQNNKVPILVSIACGAGQSDIDVFGGVYGDYDKSFSEAILLSPAGAVAYIGGGRTNYGGIPAYLKNGSLDMTVDQPYMQGMLNYAFKAYSENKTSLGEIAAGAIETYNENKDIDYNDIDKLTFFAFTLLGDPALRIPEKPSVSLPDMPKQEAFEQDSLLGGSALSRWSPPQGFIPFYTNNIKINISADSENIDFKKINLLTMQRSEEQLNLDNGNLIHEFSDPEKLLWTKAEDPNTMKQSWFFLSTKPPAPDVYLGFDWETEQLNKILGQPNEIKLNVVNDGDADAENITVYLYKNEDTLIDSQNIEEILVSESETVIFSWVPDSLGLVTLRAEANLAGDSFFGNNEAYSQVNVVPKSLINNGGETSISGYLLLQILKDDREISSLGVESGKISIPQTSYYGDKKIVRVKFKNKEQEYLFLKQDLDVAYYKKGEYADVVIYESQGAVLKSNGFDFTSLNVNRENLFESDFGEERYHGYEDIEPELRAIETLNPDIAKVSSLGKSIEGRDIWAIKISDNVDLEEEEPAILIDGNHHAREIMTVELPLYFAKFLVENYSLDRIKNLVDNREFWIVPTVNPDGLSYVETTDIFWRKNRRDNGDGSFGIDLNRNYGYKWGFDNYGSSPAPGSDSYRGTNAFSEPETQAMKNLSKNNNFILQISYHSYGEYFLYPWSYREWHTNNDNDFNAIASELVLNRGLNGYMTGPPSEILYSANGASFDWFYGEREDKLASYGFAFEINNYYQGGFRPDPNLIPVTQQEHLEPFLYLSEYVPTLNPPAELPGATIHTFKVVLNDSSAGNLRTIMPGAYLTLDNLFGQQTLGQSGTYIVESKFLDNRGGVIERLESNYTFTLFN